MNKLSTYRISWPFDGVAKGLATIVLGFKAAQSANKNLNSNLPYSLTI